MDFSYSPIIQSGGDYNFKPTKIWQDTNHENRYKVPESFQLTGADDGLKHVQFRASFTKKKAFKPNNLLRRMNSAVRFVAERFAKPMDYGYDLDYVIEVKNGDKVDRVQGVGRYHLYHYNK